MKINKKYLFYIYIVFIVVFIFWLIFSNSIIIIISGAEKPRKIMFHEELFKDYVFFDVDQGIQIVNNLTGVLNITGWAFVETEVNNLDRDVSIILKGESVCYKIACKNILRDDIRRIFQGRNNHVQGNLLGFTTDFSTIGIQDGIYDVYVYCKENETNYGMSNLGTDQMDVGFKIEKKGSNLKYYVWEPELLEKPLKTTREETNMIWIDIARENNGRMSIEARRLANEENSDLQKVYIELTNEKGEVYQYTTRGDTTYENAKYNNNSFRTSIPMNKIINGTYTINALLEDNGQVWRSEPCTLIKSDGNIELVRE